MHQTIPCNVCGEDITSHTNLFAAHLHTGVAVSAPDDGLDLEAMRAKLVASKERIDEYRAQLFGLGYLPWRSAAQASGPQA